MEVKKSPEADLEQYRPTWLLMGYAVALSILFVALEWTASDSDAALDMEMISDLLFEEELEAPLLPQPETVTPPPPSANPPMVKEEEVMVVENEAEEALPELSEQIGTEAIPDKLPTDTPPAEAATDGVFVWVDELPEFPIGGQKGLMRYLTQHIRYPAEAQQRNIQGCVLCQFIVNTDGSISDVQVLQQVHPALDNEALRVLRGMPRWKPGRLQGEPVRVRYTLPVMFRLQ